MLNKRKLVGYEIIENCFFKILNNNFLLYKINVYFFVDFLYLFGFFQVNLFFFVGVVVFLCLSVILFEVDQCGYYYYINDYYIIYYLVYYK